MLEYCYDNDGYSMQHQDNYHFMQMQDDYHHSPHAGLPVRPPLQYSAPNMMTYNGNYSTHQDGFPGTNNYGNACHGQPVNQSSYYGSSDGTNGYYMMSHAAMGGKPPYHHAVRASHVNQGGVGGGGGGGGYNYTLSSDLYDYNYENNIRRPNMMQGEVMDYGHGNWGNTTTGYRYNNQVVSCMPYGYKNNDDQWRTKSLA